MSFLGLWLALGALGGVGALLRWIVDTRVLAVADARGLPTGTFAVNLSGSTTLGLLTGLALHGHTLLLAGTALVGSYTTFSTWMFESERLVEERREPAAAANITVSLLAGLACIALGRWAGGQL